MKRVTATDARKEWFRLLDDVAAGEVVVIERGGKLLELSRREPAHGLHEPPDYTDILRVSDADVADVWGWEWEGPGRPLAPTLKPRPQPE